MSDTSSSLSLHLAGALTAGQVDSTIYTLETCSNLDEDVTETHIFPESQISLADGCVGVTEYHTLPSHQRVNSTSAETHHAVDRQSCLDQQNKWGVSEEISERNPPEDNKGCVEALVEGSVGVTNYHRTHNAHGVMEETSVTYHCEEIHVQEAHEHMEVSVTEYHISHGGAQETSVVIHPTSNQVNADAEAEGMVGVTDYHTKQSSQRTMNNCVVPPGTVQKLRKRFEKQLQAASAK